MEHSELYAQSSAIFPGGVNSPVRSFLDAGQKHPLFIRSAYKSFVIDEKNNEISNTINDVFLQKSSEEFDAKFQIQNMTRIPRWIKLSWSQPSFIAQSILATNQNDSIIQKNIIRNNLDKIISEDLILNAHTLPKVVMPNKEGFIRNSGR